MTEATFTQAIRRALPDGVYVWKINARFANGVPDAWYSGVNDDLWVEYKYLPTMPKQVLPKLTALQKKWLNDRHKEGRNVAVIVGSPKGCLILVDGQWNSKTDATRLKTRRQVVDYIAAKVGVKFNARKNSSSLQL